MPTVSSAGWIIFNCVSKGYIHGSFYEITGAIVGSYQGESLGLCALHLIAAAISKLYGDSPLRTNYIVTMSEHWRKLKKTTIVSRLAQSMEMLFALSKILSLHYLNSSSTTTYTDMQIDRRNDINYPSSNN